MPVRDPFDAALEKALKNSAPPPLSPAFAARVLLRVRTEESAVAAASLVPIHLQSWQAALGILLLVAGMGAGAVVSPDNNVKTQTVLSYYTSMGGGLI